MRTLTMLLELKTATGSVHLGCDGSFAEVG
jgi:hypothetical protein